MGGTDSQGERNQAPKPNNGREIKVSGHQIKAKAEILIVDFILSFMWAWTGQFNSIIVHQILGLGHNWLGEAVTYVFKVMSMFLFAGFGSVTKGGAHNPLTVLTGAVSSDFNQLMFTVGARIPAEVLGSIVGVKLLMANFSDIGGGPKLNVELHHGALIEGILAFTLAVIAMGLAQTLSGSFYMKNWISIISKISLQVLASDFTGASTNPANAIGWAYARGNHMTKEHLLVYWLAPVEATVFGVWIYKLLFKTGQDKKKKTKSE